MNDVGLEVIYDDDQGVILDLKYATDDNLMGRPVYTHPICALHKDAINHLRKAVQLAGKQGYTLKIFDAYRPPEVQWIFWNFCADPEFFADPRRGSPHSRGVAIDLTLCKDGEPLDMGTAFDEFDKRSHHGNRDVSVEAQQNRELLRQIMLEAGWDDYKNEWWHYQLFKAREKYSLISHAESGFVMMSDEDVRRSFEIAAAWPPLMS